MASIEFVGAYSAGNFHVTAGISGTVEIADPVVPNGGSVAPGSAGSFPQRRHRSAEHRLRRADDARLRGKQRDTHGELTVTDGRHAASIVLLGNYMAASFVTEADGHGGTLVTETPETAAGKLTLTQPQQK